MYSPPHPSRTPSWPQNSSVPVTLPSLRQSSTKGDQLQGLLLGSQMKARTWLPISHQVVTIPAVWVWPKPVTCTGVKGSKHNYRSPEQPSMCLCLSPRLFENTDKWAFLMCLCQFWSPSPYSQTLLQSALQPHSRWTSCVSRSPQH